MAGARVSLAEWPDRDERAVCVRCRELVELADRRGSVLGTNPPPDPPSAADSRSLPGVPAPGELAGTAQQGDDTAAPPIPGEIEGRCRLTAYACLTPLPAAKPIHRALLACSVTESA